MIRAAQYTQPQERGAIGGISVGYHAQRAIEHMGQDVCPERAARPAAGGSTVMASRMA